MPSLPARVLVTAATLAAVDCVLVRLESPWRPVEASLYLQASVLWAVFALLAALPARLTLARLRAWSGSEPSALRAGLVLGFWTALPVLVHGTLDRHTAFEGLAGVKAVRPWLEAVGVTLALFGLVLGLDRTLPRLPLERLRWPALALVLFTGSFLPWRSHSVPSPGVAGSAHAAGRAGSSAGGARPNVLLFVWDTCRSDRLAPYGYDRETTPHLARFADEAQVFEDSLSVARFTLTSHVSLLTGLLPSTHGTRLTYLRYDRRRATSVAESFHAAGYRTGGFVGTDVLSGRTGVRSGFEVWDDQVDPPVCDTNAWSLVHDVQSLLASTLGPPFRGNGLPHWIQDFQRPAGLVLESALEWIGNGDERPWFCMINLYDVHWPYLPRVDSHEILVSDYEGPMDGYLFRSDAWDGEHEPDAADKRHISELYDAELRDLDRVVEGFLAALELDRGDTAVCLTSDHGEAFGEAGRWKHEDILEPQVRVPLMIRPAATRPPGRRVSAPVSALDVAPTLLGLAGLPVPEELPGMDLLAREPGPERERLVEDRDHFDPSIVSVALYSGPWKLVRRGFPPEATYTLHDLRVDPLGALDVQADHPRVFERLHARMVELRELADVRDRASEEFTQSAEGLKALGYVGGDE